MRLKHTNKATVTVDLNNAEDVEAGVMWLINNSGFRIEEKILFGKFLELREQIKLSCLCREYKDVRKRQLEAKDTHWATECGLSEALHKVKDAKTFDDLDLTTFWLSVLLAQYSDCF